MSESEEKKLIVGFEQKIGRQEIFTFSSISYMSCLWAPIDQLCSSPLLHKIQLAVILGIEITDVTLRGDVLLQVRLLVLEVRLCEQ